MRRAREKAIEIATALTVANIAQNGYGSNENAANDLANFYLALENRLEEAFSEESD